MPMSNQASRPLPVTLSLDLPPSLRQEVPLVTIPCRPRGEERPVGISWIELLGER